MATTWSTTNKNGFATLSNGGLTVAAGPTTPAIQNVEGRCDAAITSGMKIRFQTTVNAVSGQSTGIGLCNSSETFQDGNWLGARPDGYGYYEDGNVYHNYNGTSTPVATYAPFTTGDVISVDVDYTNGKVWFSKNGVCQGSGTPNPATNTGGLPIAADLGAGSWFAAYTVYNDGAGNFGRQTVNFGATAFGTAAPAGFTGLDSGGSVGSASGTGAASGVGKATAAAKGSASGTGAATAIGKATAAAVGSASGAGAASAIGKATAAAVGSATGTGAASAIGAATAQAVGSATGSSTAQGTSASTSISAAVGSASGKGTATGVGASIAAAVGASAGVGAATATGASTAASTGASSGTGSASGVGKATVASVGASSGAVTASAVAVAIAASSGVSAGTSAAAGVASAVARAVGASTGTGAAQAFIVAIFASVGTSAGAGAAAGISAGIFASVGTSTGTGAANGRASAIAAAVGAAAGISGATGVGIGVFYAETLAGAALARLRFATSPGQPLDGVFIPPTRHQQVPPGTLSALTCYASSERGQGNNKSVPVLVLVDTLNIVGYVAQGREAATDLDQSVGKLIQAVLNLLLEDATFLALFAYVEAVNVEKEDDLTGKDAQEYDKVDFRIELELAGGQTEYTPVYTTPLRLIDVQATIGDVTVEQQVNFLQ